MIQTPTRERAKSSSDERTNKARYVFFVAKFLAGWLLSLVLLAFVGLTYDINWAKPQISYKLSELLHRKVHLGKLRWQFGFNGLAISTDQLAIVERDHLPLLRAQTSEIGIAFLPLLHGKLHLRYLKLKKPEFWAIYLGNRRWNFSDLLDVVVDVHMADITNGTLHVRDFSKPLVLVDRLLDKTITPMDLENVEMKLVLPKRGKRWPINLSYELPRLNYRTKVKLTALGSGSPDDWESNNYRFDLAVEDLKPKDLAPLVRIRQIEDSLVNLKVDGEGSLKKGIVVKTRFSAVDMNPGESRRLPAISGTGALNFGTDKISWQDFIVNIADLSVSSNGEVDHWRTQSYAHGKGSLGPLAELFALKALAFDRHNIGLNKTYNLNLHKSQSGDEPKAKIEFTVKLNPASKQVEEILLATPFARAINADSKTDLTGQIVTNGNGRVEIPKARLTVDNGVIIISGFLDKDQRQAHLKFSATQFPLKRLFEGVKDNPQLKDIVPPLNLIGTADIDGQFDGNKGKTSLVGQAMFRGVKMPDADGSSLLSALTGKVTFNDSEIVLNQLRTNLDNGYLVADGKVPLTAQGTWHLNVHATHCELAKLGKLLKTFRLTCPEVLAKSQISGVIKELDATITGPLKRPTIVLSILPEKIKLGSDSLSQMQAVGGSIKIDGNKLVLSDMTINTSNGKLQLSLKTDDWQNSDRLQDIDLTTPNLPLEDIETLANCLPGSSFQKSYRQLLSQWHMSAFKGTVSGKLSWSKKEFFAWSNHKGHLHGRLTFADVSCKLKDQNVQQLSGIVTLNDSKISIHRAVGLIDRSKFAFAGQVLDHQSKLPKWQGSLKLDAYPNDLLPLAQSFTGAGKDPSIALESDKPVKLEITLDGDAKATQVHLAARVDSDTTIHLQVEQLGWVKPVGQAISLNSDLCLTGLNDKDNAIEIKNFETHMGQAVLKGAGKIVDGKLDAGVETEGDFNPSLVTKNLVFNDKHFAKLKALLKDTSGLMKGQMRLSGSLDNLFASGSLNFENMDLPGWGLTDTSGRMELDQWQLVAANPQATNKDQISRAHLKITKAKLGQIETQGIEAELSQQGAPGAIGKPWLIKLNNFAARLAQGSLDVKGSFEPLSGRILVDSQLSKIDVNKFFTQMTGQEDEITGEASGHIAFTSVFGNNKEFLKHLNGSGDISIHNGKVARFGNLEKKVTQANFVAQGLLGFNLNNLLQSFVPVRSGEFKKFFGTFQIQNGLISFDELRFAGDDMRLWADGVIDLPEQEIKLAVAGNVPRVSASMIGGPIGQLSRNITIQKFLDTVTLHKLQGVPTLPLIGDIASDKPRAFAFTVIAHADQPALIGKSIEKSFGWLPSQPTASAHPIPSL